MFRNQYDTAVTVWSPEGRLLQVGLNLKQNHDQMNWHLLTMYTE